MDAISKEEFIDWKSQTVTKEVFNVIEQRIADAQEILGNTAGEDPLNDRFLVGMIRAFRELQEISYDD